MKKFLKALLVLSVFIVSSFAFVACGKAPKVEKIYVDIGTQTSITVTHKSDWTPEENLKVKAVLTDGSEIELDAEDCLFEDFNINNVGTQVVKVSYGAYQTTVTVIVKKYITGIAITSGSVPTEVLHTDELDLSNATVTVFYSDETKDENVSEGVTHSTPSTDTVSLKNTVKFYYQGFECEAEYEVKRKLLSISLDNNSYAKEVSWNENADAFDYDAVKVYATYADSVAPELVTLSASNFTRRVTTNIARSNDYFTVSYGGKTINSEDIEVYKSVSSIRYVSGLQSNIIYGEDFNTSNVEIEVTYNDGSKETVNNSQNASALVFGDADGEYTFALGANNLKITYVCERKVSSNANSCNFVVNVEDASNKTLIVNGNEGVRSNFFIKADKALMPTEEEIKANFTFSEDWRVNDVLISDLSLINISVSAKVGGIAGEYVATITYKDYVVKTISVYSIVDWSEANISVESISIVPGSLKVNVENGKGTNPVESLQLSVKYAGIEEPLVLDYLDYDGVGETLDASDLMVVSFDNQATFSDAVVKAVEFKVTYQGQVAAATINVQRSLVRIEAPEVSVLWNASGTIDFSSYDFTIIYLDGSVTVKGPASKNGYEMNKASLATTHSYDQACELTFALENCYGKSSAVCEFTYNVYEEATSLSQEGAVVEVEWDNEETYAQLNSTSMKVYLNYTSGNKEEIQLAEGTTSGYKVEQNIDRTIAGKQNFIISYYRYNGSELEKVDGFTVTVQVTVVDTILDYVIEGVSSTVLKDEVIDYTKVYLKPIFKSGKEASQTDYVVYNNVQVSPIDVSVANVTKTLSVVYNSKTYTKEIRVVEYNVLGFSAPTFVTQYNGRKQNQYDSTESTGVKGFNTTEEKYVVGDDNAFVFNPVVQVKYGNNTTGLKEDAVLKATTKIWQDGVGFVETTNAEYISFNGVTHEFTFGSEAKNQRFRVEVSLDDTRYSFVTSFEFDVVDGYNVYNAKQLSILDNKNGGNKWSNFLGAEYLGQTLNPASIVIHGNITITKDDIPTIHFYQESDVNTGDLDYGWYTEFENGEDPNPEDLYGQDKVIGSLKDTEGSDEEGYRFIYSRDVANGTSFTLHGNFFTLDLSKMPLVVRENGEINSTGHGVDSHVATFALWGDFSSKVTGSAEVRNIRWYGNAKKDNTDTNSGGVIGVKASSVNATFYNNLAEAFYIPYFFETPEENCEDIVMNLTKSNAYDSYNTLLYVWSVSRLNIDDCKLIGAGGPVMICDHVKHENDGSGGYTSNVFVDTKGMGTSVLESWVAGTEGWFGLYEGSGALAQQIKAFSALYQTSEYGKTLIREFDDREGQFINIVAVYKSGSIEGLSDCVIHGQMVFEGAEHNLKLTDNENLMYIASQVGLLDAALYQSQDKIQALMTNYGLSQEQAVAQLMANEEFIATVTGYVKGFASQGVFMVTDTGSVGFPGLDMTVNSGWYLDASVNFNGKPNVSSTQSGSKMYVYLPNGMAAVLGFYNA